MLELFHRLGLPPVASAHGAELDHMMVIVHWLMLALFVGWGAFFIYCLIRFSAKNNPRADYQGVKSHISSWLEGGVAVFEAVLIIGFALPLWAQRVNAFPAEQEAVNVRVVGQQFKWWFQYPGKDGKFGKGDVKLIDSAVNPLGLDKNDPNALDDITAGLLHLPVNKPAILHLSSLDVIHSFGIPEMRVKQDTIPGMRIPMWFTPTKTTKEMREFYGNDKFYYEIACAQLCGIGHAGMRGRATVETEEEYTAWLDSQEPTLGSGDDDEEIW